MTDRDAIEARLCKLRAAQEAATGWGAAVGARSEEIKGLESQLRRLDLPSPLSPETATLNPCPFCGGEAGYYASGEAVFKANWTGHVCHCKNCQSRVSTAIGKEAAVAMWNARALTSLSFGHAQCQQLQITDEMVKAGAAAMCCQAETLGCAAKNKDSEFSTCMLSTFMQDARRCLDAALSDTSTDRGGK